MESRLLTTTILVIFGCFFAGYYLGRLGDSPDVGVGGEEKETVKLTALSPGDHSRGTGSALAYSSKLARSADHTLFEKLRANIRVAHTADVEEIPELMKLVQREGGLAKELILKILAERWVEADPFGALEALIGREPFSLKEMQDIVLAAAGKADARRAWRMLQGIGEDGVIVLSGALNNGKGRDQMMSVVLGSIAGDDPELAIELLVAIELPGSYRETIGNVLGKIARDQPTLALDALKKLPPGVDSRVDVVLVAFGSLGETDRATGVARLGEMSSGQRYRAAHGIAGRWADEDPAAALDWALGLPGTIPNGDALVEIFARYSKIDAPAAAALIERVPDSDLRASLGRWVFRGWVGNDPEAAIAWAQSSLEGKARIEVHEQLLESHSKHLEFPDQLRIANGLPEESDAVGRFAKRWAKDDPLAAANWALGRGEGARRILRDLGKDWVKSDLAGMEEFAASVEDPRLQRQLQGQVDEAKKQQEVEK